MMRAIHHNTVAYVSRIQLCRLLTVCALCFFLPVSLVGATDLDRGTAEQIIAGRGLDYAIIRVGATNNLSFEDIMVTNHLALPKQNAMDMSRRQDNITLLPAAMPYFLKYEASQSRNGGMCLMGCLDILLSYGRVTNFTCTGISTIDANHKKVEFEFSVEKSEIGRIIGGPTAIKMATLFELYDDGWRYKEILWNESLALTGWNKSYLTQFMSTDQYANSVLWNMHESGTYSPDSAALLAILEKTKDPAALDTVAWVYKDSGDTQKAVDIYENRLLPILRDSGNLNELKKYQGYLEKIRASSPPPATASPAPAPRQDAQPAAGPAPPQRPAMTAPKETKDQLAMQLIAETLAAGRIGAERTIAWNNAPLFGVTPLESYRYLNKFTCWKYKVVSYETGQPVTLAKQANACLAQNKWYPYSLLAHPTQKMSKEQYLSEMIGY